MASRTKKAPKDGKQQVIAGKCPNCGEPVPAKGKSKNVCVTCRVTLEPDKE